MEVQGNNLIYYTASLEIFISSRKSFDVKTWKDAPFAGWNLLPDFPGTVCLNGILSCTFCQKYVGGEGGGWFIS